MSDWDRQTTPGGVEGPQWVSAAEAADVAGVTPGTVRYWARNGLIVSEVVEGPAGERTLVRLDEVVQHARQEDGSRRPGSPAPGPSGEVVTDLPARTSELAPILKSIPEIMAQLTAATDRAARAETKVEFLSAQLADMRRRLEEAQAGGGAGPGSGDPVTLPEAWKAPVAEESAEVVAEEAPVAEPGPDTIDWGTSASTSDSGGAAESEPPPVPPPPAGGVSLDEIWAQPAPPQPAAPAAEPDRADVDWHEPAGAAASAEQPATTRPANAPVPDSDDFYGPRRRRWFKRRR